MAEFKIRRLVPMSVAKFLALYTLFMSVLALILDLVGYLIDGSSAFVGSSGFGAWGVYAIALIIGSPIVGYISGLVVAWIINLALKITDGLDLEVQ
jgi:hypothetical protein